MGDLKAILLLNGYTVTTLAAGAIQAVKGTEDWYAIREAFGITLYDKNGKEKFTNNPADAAREILFYGKRAAMVA